MLKTFTWRGWRPLRPSRGQYCYWNRFSGGSVCPSQGSIRRHHCLLWVPPPQKLGESGRDRWILRPSKLQMAQSELPQRVSNLRADYPDAIILVSLHWGEEYVTYAPKSHQTWPEPSSTPEPMAYWVIIPMYFNRSRFNGAPIPAHGQSDLTKQPSRRRTGLFTMQWKQAATGKWTSCIGGTTDFMRGGTPDPHRPPRGGLLNFRHSHQGRRPRIRRWNHGTAKFIGYPAGPQIQQ